MALCILFPPKQLRSIRNGGGALLGKVAFSGCPRLGGGLLPSTHLPGPGCRRGHSAAPPLVSRDEARSRQTPVCLRLLGPSGVCHWGNVWLCPALAVLGWHSCPVSCDTLLRNSTTRLAVMGGGTVGCHLSRAARGERVLYLPCSLEGRTHRKVCPGLHSMCCGEGSVPLSHLGK